MGSASARGSARRQLLGGDERAEGAQAAADDGGSSCSNQTSCSAGAAFGRKQTGRQVGACRQAGAKGVLERLASCAVSRLLGQSTGVGPLQLRSVQRSYLEHAPQRLLLRQLLLPCSTVTDGLSQMAGGRRELHRRRRLQLARSLQHEAGKEAVYGCMLHHSHGRCAPGA